MPSVLFEPGTDLYGLYVWHYKLRYKVDFFQIYFCWWRRIYSFSLTPFSETYELRGYVVEGYQRYIPNLVMWHAECCCEMIIVWSFVIWSFVWSFILVIITLIICWPKHGFEPMRGFVDETSSSLTPRNGQNRKDAARLLGVASLRVCAFPSGKGWYHGMEPRYLLMLKTLYDCVNWLWALGW